MQVKHSPETAPPIRTETNVLRMKKGQVVGKRYTILDIIGRGGMGCIFKVYDNTLKEEVALKMLLPEYVKDQMVVQRFFNEAKIARQLSHLNIVRVHDIGVQDDAVYISMEYLKGKSLRDIMDDLPKHQGLPVKETLRIFDGLCAALEYAHNFTVHRDLKPENVMVLPDGTVKLMDFGISKLMNSARMTQASLVMGTPHYMAPEQWANSAGVDARADLYSIGVMLYEVVTGLEPSSAPKLSTQIDTKVPPSLEPIIAKCVERDPKNRYQSTSELRADIRKLIEKGSTDTEVKSDGAANIPVKRVAGVALILLVLSAAGAAVYSLQTSVPAAENGAVSTPLASTASSTPDNGFGRLEGLVERAETIVAAGGAIERDDLVIALTAAREAWSEATYASQSGEENAEALGKKALSLFSAAIIGPALGDMTFIPAGSVNVTAESSSVDVEPFFIDRYETTQGQFLEFKNNAEWDWPSQLSYQPEMPMEYVSFYDAQAFAAWNGKSLPSEAQWAHAAYGAYDSPQRFPWGEDPMKNEGYRNESGAPRPPGEFENDLTDSGCYDMAGNVMEWTRSALPSGKARTVEDYASFTFGTPIVARGGFYNDNWDRYLNVRDLAPFEARMAALGFRCVVELPSNLDEIDRLLREFGANSAQ